ncbi:DEAD/DEAH box helicase [Propionicicella superfundia]|uniref:DEAD/DEAH box helicase n=1 Tax=Propionicicella superfundia TaxID=348582 RepID=UPI00068499AF|nr:DEAD/DEAH box helicase [Propionicicella superfundia]
MSHPDHARSRSEKAGFAALGVPSPLVSTLTRQGIETPFPIQTATLPDTLAGRDVLGRGRTGSGKTLAFALPLVARLARLVPSGSAVPQRTRPGRPRGLILAPTRELAGQIQAVVEPLAAAAGLTVMTIFGGVGQQRQVQRLQRGTDIVVATPGRLEDLMGQGHAHLDAVVVTVLDEADHMADLGFLPGVTRILAATPAGGQRLLFSATLDNGIDKLAKRFLSRPLVHSVDSEQSPVAAMTHHVLLVGDAGEKRRVVRALASGAERRLLFTRTKHQARKLARELTADGVPAVELHGNLSQNARERGLRAFAEGEVRVMVATDIAARGIHVDGIELVVHVDPPAEHKAYLHRSGRTARAGHEGDVVTLVLPEQRRDFQALARAARITAPAVDVSAGDATVRELTGAPAAKVEPSDAPPAAARRGEPQPRRVTSGSGRSGSVAGDRASGARNGAKRTGAVADGRDRVTALSAAGLRRGRGRGRRMPDRRSA